MQKLLLCDSFQTGTVFSQTAGCCAILNKSNKQSMTKQVELFEFLYRECQKDHDLLAMVIDEYVVSLSNSNRLDELEDFIVNNFGDN